MNNKLNINDYIGKRYAVECSSKEEWQSILDLAPDKVQARYNHYVDANPKIMCLSTFGDYWTQTIKYNLINAGWGILSASDFLDTPTEKTLPRVMLVSETNNIKTAKKRVVFAIKCGHRIAWNSAETIEESEESIGTTAWIYAWELKELTIFPFNLSPTDAQSIIDIACNTWKVKLAEKWAINIVKKESITVSVEEYNEMYAACTDTQKELFDKIFK